MPEGYRCPDCASELARTADGASCEACGARYAMRDGILDLVGAKSDLDRSEVETQDRVADHYEQARYRHAFSRAYHAHTLDQLLELAPPRGAVLDDGCGNGFFLEHARGRGGAATRWVGLDVSTGMLRHARRRLGDAAELVRGDACRLPFADATFDVVYARGLLHHLPDPPAGAREVARVLKPGGVLVTLDPNRSVVSDLPRRLANRTSHFDEGHKNFRARELEAILSPHLRVEEVSFVGYVAYPLLGFPDLLNFGRLLPLDRLGPALVRLDDLLGHVPALRTLGWGLVARASKK
jgi:ubiquinone/menaquinone biosynthesis C-methylase UbiE